MTKIKAVHDFNQKSQNTYMVHICPNFHFLKDLKEGTDIRYYIKDEYKGLYTVVNFGRMKFKHIKDHLIHLVFGYKRSEVRKMQSKMARITEDQIKEREYIIIELKKV